MRSAIKATSKPRLGASVSPTMLSLSLNGRTFFQLSNIIEHIHDYPVSLERVELYCHAVEQTAAIFEIRSAFASDLMKALTVMLSRLL